MSDCSSSVSKRAKYFFLQTLYYKHSSKENITVSHSTNTHHSWMSMITAVFTVTPRADPTARNLKFQQCLQCYYYFFAGSRLSTTNQIVSAGTSNSNKTANRSKCCIRIRRRDRAEISDQTCFALFWILPSHLPATPITAAILDLCWNFITMYWMRRVVLFI